MTEILLPLGAPVFGEWLGALGLLRLANSLAPGSTLHFDADNCAVLMTAATEAALVTRVFESAHADRIQVQLLRPAAAPDADTVSIGGTLLASAWRGLSDPELPSNADAKSGLKIRWIGLQLPPIDHFLGEAMSDCAGIRSPLKLWAGTVTFPSILRRLCDVVRQQPQSASLDQLLGLTSRETQRLRFDHRSEQFTEDGGHDTTGGRESRPVVEWLSLIGLTFFPACAGNAALLHGERTLRAPIWRQPLTCAAATIAVHSGQFAECFTFPITSDGKLKKIRPGAVFHSTQSSTP